MWEKQKEQFKAMDGKDEETIRMLNKVEENERKAKEKTTKETKDDDVKKDAKDVTVEI